MIILEDPSDPGSDDGGDDSAGAGTDRASQQGEQSDDPAEDPPGQSGPDTATSEPEDNETPPGDSSTEERDDEPAAPIQPAGPTAPLTGLLTTDSSLSERRAAAVKVDNTTSTSRPQVGLGVADIVYEVLIEGGSTRFIGVFHSNVPSAVGPVRSARSTDIDLMADLGAPYLAASGANPGVLSELRRAHEAGTLVDINGLRGGEHYVRVSDRPAPNNFLFQYDLISEHEPTLVEPVFEFGGDNPPGVRDAAGVTVTFHAYSGTRASHIWDPQLGGWVRIQDGTLHLLTGDYGESEAVPANVVVIFTPHSSSPADPESPQVQSFGSGEALILTAGAVHRGSWERTRGVGGFRFEDTAGRRLTLSPGSTWVLMANTSRRFPVAEAAILNTAEAETLLAAARAAAEAAAGS